LNIFQTIASNFNAGKGALKILENFIWLSFDKVIKAVVGLIITAWLARYLGQENFGVWNYALAFIAISSALSTLGLDTIFLRDIVRNADNKNKILGSTFFVKAVSSLMAFIACIVVIYFIRPHGDLTKLMVTIMAMSFLFQAFDVIDFYFKSQMQSRYVVYARNIPFLVISSAQLIFIINHAPLIMFAWLFLLESILAAILLIVLYKFKGGEFSRWKTDQETTTKLLKDGWPLFISFISSMLYLKVGQIMIGQMLDDRSVGIFSAALKIHEIPFSFLVLLTSVSFPKIVELYERDKELFFKRYSQVTSLYTLSSIVLLIILILFGKQIILILFGSDYLESYYPLVILSVGLVFIYNGMLRSSYLSVTNNEKIIFYTSLMSAVLNVVLNYILIRKYGILGSATAMLITHFVALFLSNYFFKATKRISFIQFEAFFRLRFLDH
jgi:PST family polysaccharide transporter